MGCRNSFKALQDCALARVASGRESPKAAPFQPIGIWALQGQIPTNPYCEGPAGLQSEDLESAQPKNILSAFYFVLTLSLRASPGCLPVAVQSWQLCLAGDLCETCWSWLQDGLELEGLFSVSARYWRRQSDALRPLMPHQFLFPELGWSLLQKLWRQMVMEYLQNFVYLKCREQESLCTLLNVDNIFFFCSGCQPLLFLHNYLPLWRSGNLCSSGASLPNAGDLVSVLTPEGLCAAREQDSLRVSWGNNSD